MNFGKQNNDSTAKRTTAVFLFLYLLLLVGVAVSVINQLLILTVVFSILAVLVLIVGMRKVNAQYFRLLNTQDDEKTGEDKTN